MHLVSPVTSGQAAEQLRVRRQGPEVSSFTRRTEGERVRVRVRVLEGGGKAVRVRRGNGKDGVHGGFKDRSTDGKKDRRTGGQADTDT